MLDSYPGMRQLWLLSAEMEFTLWFILHVWLAFWKMPETLTHSLKHPEAARVPNNYDAVLVGRTGGW